MKFELNDGSSLEIRSARETDVRLILQLIRELAEYEKLSHQVTATEAQLKETLFGAKPFAEVLIAEHQGVAVGFALYFHNYSTFLAKPGIYLEDLYVRPASRSFGIGKRLLAHLAGLAVERGCGRLEWSVLDWNRHAIEFYEKLGAKRLNEWQVYRLTDEALKSLARAAH